jgi:hypothetical protein
MLDLRSLRQALGGHISNGQLLCPGPGHSAADRSLSVKIDAGAPDGFVVHSFAGDDPIACRDHVRAKAGLEPFKPNGNGKRQRASEDAISNAVMAAAMAQSNGKTPGKLVATYPYVERDGTLLYQVLRLEPKSFRQRRPDGNGGWIWKLDDVRRVLYRWQELLQYPDGTVFAAKVKRTPTALLRSANAPPPSPPANGRTIVSLP